MGIAFTTKLKKTEHIYKLCDIFRPTHNKYTYDREFT